VRRASAKCIEAVIATRREMVTDFYQHISPALIARFRGTPASDSVSYSPFAFVATRFKLR
jgi:hypothetical protein